MSMRRQIEYPANRTAVSWIFDVLLAVAAGLSSIPAESRAHTAHGASAAALVVLIVVPLVFRRIWPNRVFAVVLILSIVMALWNPLMVAGFSLLIALYTVAAMQPRRDALTAAILLETFTLVAVPFVSGGYWWLNEIFLSGMVAAALGFGLYVGTRRAYLAELRDRADRLERERDQQVALAAAAERGRIAREMHDIVAHHLTVMVALSDGAIAASASSQERAVDVMRSVSATGRKALADTRQMLGGLRQDSAIEQDSGSDSASRPNPALRPVPDLAELDVLLEQVRSAGLPTSYEVHGHRFDVSSGMQLTVYRLVQEALTNTLKHGGEGARASVRLAYLDGELRVEIEDDGAGSRAPTPVGVGSGLVGMQERVHAYGGDVVSGPRGTRGWRVTARLKAETDAVG